MPDFVYNGTALPTNKVDARPLSGPESQYITAAEWNLVMQAIVDLRNAVLAGDHLAVAPVSGQLRIGTRVIFRLSDAVPSSGTAAVGDIAYKTTPAAGGTLGWICTSAGTPGTWKEFGLISL